MMAITAREARQQILDDLAEAIEQMALAVACLGEAFELLDVGSADRLQTTLFTPAQRAYGRGMRAHNQFAEHCGLAGVEVEPPAPGRTSQGAKAFIERAMAAAAEADGWLAQLQDSGLPVESGTPELRNGLSEVRASLGELPLAARRFLSTLGR
jgi:hypothetical protein